MGNASSLLDGSYELEEAFPELTSAGQKSDGLRWSLQLAEDSDGRRVSVFLYPADTDASKVEYVDNAIKYFKMLRHPGIPKFLDMKRNASGCMLITEQVTPLEFKLQKLTSVEICAGLYNIIEVLAFLHDRGGVCHNNIGMSAVFVGSNGRWLLGGLEYMCRFDEATVAYLNKCKSLRNMNSLAPEEKDARVQTSTKCSQARDVYAFGILAEHLLSYLDDLGDLTKTFELRIQDEFLNSDPSQRPHMSTLLQDRLFKIDYVEILYFLQNITVKTESEKKSFFSCAAKKVFHLPPAIVATRLVHPLLSRFVLLDSTATTCLIPHLLTPCKGTRKSIDFKDGELNPILPEALFKRYVIPEIFRIFYVYNVHIRLTLLRHFESYVHLFAVNTLQKFILPHILVAVKDSCDELSAASLHATACLVPILGGDIVIGTNRTKQFSGTTPNFSRKLNHVQEKNAEKSTGMPASNGMTAKVTEDVMLDQKEEKRRLLEIRREERRLRQQEKKQAKGLAFGTEFVPVNTTENNAKDKLVDDDHCSAEDSVSDSVSTGLEVDQCHEETMTDAEDVTSDDEFDREIEDELVAMDSVVIVKQNKDIENGPPVSVDWSDIAATPTKAKNWSGNEKGVLRLKGHSPDQVAISARDTDSDRKEGDIVMESSMGMGWSDTDVRWDTTDDWEDVDTSSNPRGTSATFSPLKTKHTPHRARLSQTVDNSALGAEFDVMAIEIQKKITVASTDPIEQLFAEMQPTIALPTSGGLLGMLGKSNIAESGQRMHSDDKTTKTKPSSLFAANYIPNEDSNGWGEDLNWNMSDG